MGLVRGVGGNSNAASLAINEPLPRVLGFTLPLILNALFRRLCDFISAIVIKHYLNASTLNTINAACSLGFLVLNFILNSYANFNVPITRDFNTESDRSVRGCLFGNTILYITLDIIFAVIAALATTPLLRLVRAPTRLFPSTITCVHVVFLNVPAAILFGCASAILHDLNSSRRPFCFLLFSDFLGVKLS